MVRRPFGRRLSGALACIALVLGAMLMAAPPVRAVSRDPEPDAATVDHIEAISDRWLRVFVNSPAMGRTVQVQLLVPADRSRHRPTLYLLDGRAASDDGNNWLDQGHAQEFFADKDINVVLTIGGPAGYYTDWQRPDPVLGNNKWETFLTHELPPLIDSEFEGNGRNAVEGVSMGAEAATMLAMRNRRLYQAVAGHSGCYAMGSEFGQAQARAVVGTYGGNPDNMFGDQDDPDWMAHDVLTHAERLRGMAIYLSAGSGFPGIFDNPDTMAGINSMMFGGPLEIGARACTMVLADRLARMRIPATVDFQPTGTHSWPYWAEELPRAWPTIAAAVGAD